MTEKEPYFEPRIIQQIDNRRKEDEGKVDVGMVTVLQESQMLKSELVLHEAARTENIPKIRELLGKDVDINSRNNVIIYI